MRENDTRLVRRNQRKLNSLKLIHDFSSVRTNWMKLRLLKKRGKKVKGVKIVERVYGDRPKVIKVYKLSILSRQSKISRQSRCSRLYKLKVAKFGKLSYNEIHQDMNF